MIKSNGNMHNRDAKALIAAADAVNNGDGH